MLSLSFEIQCIFDKLKMGSKFWKQNVTNWKLELNLKVLISSHNDWKLELKNLKVLISSHNDWKLEVKNLKVLISSHQ